MWTLRSWQDRVKEIITKSKRFCIPLLASINSHKYFRSAVHAREIPCNRELRKITDWDRKYRTLSTIQYFHKGGSALTGPILPSTPV